MKLNKKSVLLLTAPLLICALAGSARAQTMSAPIVIKSAPPGTTPVKGDFEVLHMMMNAIQVRSLRNPLEIHTFTYSDQIRGRMQYVFNHGGFQYGDKVSIHYVPSSEVALEIKGKPSKPA